MQSDPISSVYQDFAQDLKRFPLYSTLNPDSLLSLKLLDTNKFKTFQDTIKINFDFRDYLLVVEPPTKQSCQSLIKDKVYICHDCQLHIKGFLCENCFFKAEHHITCRFTIQQLEQKFHNQLKCSCGDYQSICYRGTCPSHHKILKKDPPKGIIAEKFYKYVLGCFQLLINTLIVLRQLKRNQNNKPKDYSNRLFDLEYFIKNQYGKRLLYQIIQIGKKSTYFVPVIQQCLMSIVCVPQTDVTKEKQDYQNQSILQIFLSFNCIENLTNLIELALTVHSQKFLSTLIFEVFNLNIDYLRTPFLNFLKNLVLGHKVQLQSFYRIIQSFNEKNKLTITNSFDFYSEIADPENTKDKKLKPIFSLIDSWKALYKQGKMTIANINEYKSKKSSLIRILANLVYDGAIFKDIIADLVKFISDHLQKKYVTKEKIEKKINLGEYCNLLSKLIYIYVEGQEKNLGQFLASLKIDQYLVEVIFYYFFESTDQFNMLSQQTIYLFGIYLHELKKRNSQHYQQYYKKWSLLKLQGKKLFQFSVKCLNIIVGQQLKRLAKLTSLKQVNPHERLELQKMQQKILQQMINIDPQPKSLVLKMLVEKILNFPRAHQIYEKLMKDKAQQKSRPKLHFCDSLFNIIFCLDQQVENVTFTPEATDGLGEIEFGYRANIVREVLAPIFSTECDELFSQLDRKSIKMIKLNQEYVKWLSFTIIDKMAGGSIPKLREQLKLKKQKVENSLVKEEIKQKQSEQAWIKNIFIRQRLQKNEKNEILSLKIEKQIPKIEESFIEKLIQEVPVEQKNQMLPVQISEQNSDIKIEQSVIKVQKVVEQSPIKQKLVQDVQIKGKSPKLLKLLQKMKNKREAVLSKMAIEEPVGQHQQCETCMICKQIGLPNNSLFHLGLLKTQNDLPALSTIFQFSIINKYSTSMCMHLIHEKCFLNLCKSNSFVCPLCKIASNVLFPSETQKINEKNIQFMENRFIYIYTQTFTEYHPEKWYILFTKNIISQVIYYLVLNILIDEESKMKKNYSKELQSKKINYAINLVRKWIDSLQQGFKDFFVFYIQKETKSCIKQFSVEQKKKNPKLAFDELAISMVLMKLFGQNQQKNILSSLSLLSNSLSSTQLQRTIKLVESFLFIDIKFQRDQIPQKKQKKFLYCFFQPPTSLLHLQYLFGACCGCLKTNQNTQIYYCMICSKSYCTACAHLKAHNKVTMRIETKTGRLQYNQPNGSTKITDIYENVFGVAYCGYENNSNATYFNYLINDDVVNRQLYNWISLLKG